MPCSKRWIALITACSALLGCDEKSPEPTETRAPLAPATTAAPTAPSAAATPQKPARPRARRGVESLFAAAGELELTAAQKSALEKLRAELDAVPLPDTRDALDGLERELVDGVKTGKIDSAKLRPHEAEIDEAHARREQAEAKALNGLHATLTPAERKSVADTLRKDLKRRAEKIAAAAPHPVAQGARGAPSKTEEKPDPVERRLEQLSHDLELDEAQKKKVQALLARNRPPDQKAELATKERRMAALADAFEKEKFDATKLELPWRANARERSKQRVDELSGLLGILRPEQRDRLAEHVERSHRKARRPMRGSPGMPGMGMQPRRIQGPPPEETGDELDVPSEE